MKRLALVVVLLACGIAAAARRPPTDYEAELARIDAELGGDRVVQLRYLRASLTNDDGDYRRAHEAISAALRVAPQSAELHFARANLLCKQHRWNEALHELSLLDDAPQVLALRADIALEQGRGDEALAVYRSLPPTWDNLARLAYVTRDDALYARAQEQLTAKEMRDYAWLELQRGELDLAAGRRDEARAHYARANAAYSGWPLIEKHMAEAR